MKCRFIFVYSGHENRLYSKGPNWWQFTFPTTRKYPRLVLLIWNLE